MGNKNNSRTWKCRPECGSQKAFTLLEVIGVLAIAAILLTALAPFVIKQITEANIRNEAATMKAFENAFTAYAMRNRYIPDHTGWAQAISEELAMPLNNVTQVFRTARIFLIDPNFRIGPALTPLPYRQGTNGSLIPQNPRVMIVSSLGPPLPESSGVSANFDRIWRTPDGSIPDVWQSSYRGRAEQLRIQRIDLRRLFKFVLISNLDSNYTAMVSIDNSPPFYVPRSPLGFAGFFFADTTIGLYNTNGVMVSQLVLQEDRNITFQDAKWNSKPAPWTPEGSQYYKVLVTQFLSAPRNPGAKFGARQINVLDFFCGYSTAYTLWAKEGFRYKTSQEQYPAEEMLEDYYQLLWQTTSDLIK